MSRAKRIRKAKMARRARWFYSHDFPRWAKRRMLKDARQRRRGLRHGIKHYKIVCQWIGEMLFVEPQSNIEIKGIT